MKTTMLALLLLAPLPALAQRVPEALPGRLDLSIERPGVTGAHLALTFTRTEAGARIVGCQTGQPNGPCFATRTIALQPAQVAELERRWRAFAAGARCRIARPDGPWTPFTVRWQGGEAEGSVYRRGDRGLNARCFAIERLGGWFLRTWRNPS